MVKPELERWTRDNKKIDLRSEYPLNENSIIFDVGGFKGDWAKIMWEKYKCYIYIFEPIKEYYTGIKSLFEGNDKIKCFNFGLSDSTRYSDIVLAGDSSSLHIKSSDKKDKIKLVRMLDFLDSIPDKKIDIIKINIEGEEYSLLEDMIKHNMLKNFINLQIQFSK
jgi:FkbM family methyltransferase